MRRGEASRQLALAEELLCNYHETSKYPFTSRPIREHPDQVHPNRPISERRTMRSADGTRVRGVQLHTTQSRVFMAAGESVVFTVAATDDDGAPLALAVEHAAARGLSTSAAPQTTLTLSDDGQNGDAAAGDGTASTTWTPVGTAFAEYAGTIRVALSVRVAGQAGAWLDVVYSPAVPATWSGPVREVVEDGALAFYLPARVESPGRYLVSARVDDARGEPLALLMFNEVLGPGDRDIRLALHGKLIHDLAPAFPLRLRDVDAFLLLEDVDPDRVLMPRISGEAHVTRIHRTDDFSPEEWQSEVKTRYLTEFSEDVEQLRDELAGLDPQRPRVSFSREQCRGFNASPDVPQA